MDKTMKVANEILKCEGVAIRALNEFSFKVIITKEQKGEDCILPIGTVIADVQDLEGDFVVKFEDNYWFYTKKYYDNFFKKMNLIKELITDFWIN